MLVANRRWQEMPLHTLLRGEHGFGDTPPPLGSRHKPFSHMEFATAFHGAIGANNAGAAPATYRVITNGPARTCIVVAEFVDSAGRGFAENIMAVHDNSQRRAVEVWSGARVFVCSNGAVFASGTDEIARRKHTAGLSLREFLRGAVFAARVGFRNGAETADRMRETPLDSRRFAEYLLDWTEADHITSAVAKAAWHEWQAPRYSEHGAATVWAGYQATTEAIKRLGTERQRDALHSTWNALSRAVLN